MNKEQKKERYEGILKLFKNPTAIKDVAETPQKHRYLCVETKILIKSEVMTRERGFDSNGRKVWLYKAKVTKLNKTDAETVLGNKIQYSKTKSHGKQFKKYEIKDVEHIRQMILDTFKTEMTAPEARKLTGYDDKDFFFRHIRMLKRKGYLSEKKVTSTGRSALFKTIKPIYFHERVIQNIKESADHYKGYVNGVAKVSAGMYHPTRMAKTSPRNYVSGSTLSMAV